MALTEQQLRDLISINLQTGSKITAIKHKEVENALVDAIFSLSSTYNNFANTEALPYEVKQIDMPQNILTNYFDIDISQTNTWGKGKTGTVFSSWAICNGNNTTQNRMGKTPIGYGDGYALNATGGSKDAVVVPHTHEYAKTDQYNQAGNGVDIGYVGVGDDKHLGASLQQTNIPTNAVSGLGANMQPYIVTLFIQRITV
jgi:hypothetical protein